MPLARGPVARQAFVLQSLSVLLLVAVVTALVTWDARADDLATARTRCLDIAQTVARSPAVAAQLRAGTPSAALQEYAEGVRQDTATDFVVVMGPDRTRFTHPDPTQIGGTFLGDLGDAASGGVFAQEFAGTLGPSMRAVVPVVADGRAVGFVSVGITIERLETGLPAKLIPIFAVAAALLVAGGVASWLVSERVRRQTHGLDEAELARMYEYHDAMLRSVREGLLLLDDRGVVQLCNEEGRRLLGLDADPAGRPVTDAGLPDELGRALRDRTLGADAFVLVGDRVLLANQQPASRRGLALGSVVTLRDHTELQAATGELATVRGLTETLRAQNHEAANRLHTVVSLIELGYPDRASDFATGELATAQRLADRLTAAGEEPVLGALLLGKAAQAAERGVEFVLDEDSRVHGLPLDDTDALTIAGNLVDNALEAVSGRSGARIEVFLNADGSSFELEVEDNGPGVPPELRDRVFDRGFTTKADAAGHGLGLALVVQTVRRWGGTLTYSASELGGAAFSVRIGGPP